MNGKCQSTKVEKLYFQVEFGSAVHQQILLDENYILDIKNFKNFWSEFIIWNVWGLQHWATKIYELEIHKLWQRINSFSDINKINLFNIKIHVDPRNTTWRSQTSLFCVNQLDLSIMIV